MSSDHLDDRRDSNTPLFARGETGAATVTASTLVMREVIPAAPLPPGVLVERRRTPRKSVIVILPDQALALDDLSQRLPSAGDLDTDVIFACAGQHPDLKLLKPTLGAARFLFAPPGTSASDLRELAMKQAPGDIVTLLNAAALPTSRSVQQEPSRGK